MCGEKWNRTATNLWLCLRADKRTGSTAYDGATVFRIWVDSWCKAITVRQLSLRHLFSLFIQPVCRVLQWQQAFSKAHEDKAIPRPAPQCRF